MVLNQGEHTGVVYDGRDLQSTGRDRRSSLSGQVFGAPGMVRPTLLTRSRSGEISWLQLTQTGALHAGRLARPAVRIAGDPVRFLLPISSPLLMLCLRCIATVLIPARSTMEALPTSLNDTTPPPTDEYLFGWDPTPGIVSVWASHAGKALV